MPDDRLIAALDAHDAETGRAFVDRLDDAVGFYKIGLGMLARGGLELAGGLARDRGKRVFLDLKLFDIGATVEAAVRSLAALGPDLLTVQGDPHVIRAAKEGASGGSARILAVTVLTSLDRADLDDACMKDGAVPDLVAERAGRAFEAGADGVVASPLEAARIRALPGAEGRLIVTPGVRPDGAGADDQKRTATPRRAIEAGADHVVVGRPIWRAADPRAAAEAILADLP